MATTYKYKQEYIDAFGGSNGLEYVEYNITPDYGARLSIGDSIVIEGRFTDKNKYGFTEYDKAYRKLYGVGCVLGMELDWLWELSSSNGIAVAWYDSGEVPGEVLTPFKLTFTVDERILAINNSGERLFRPYLGFVVCVEEGIVGSLEGFGKTYRVPEYSRIDLLSERIAPTIDTVDFSDKTEALSTFGDLVRTYSEPVATVGVTTDPLDPSVTIASRRFIFDGEFYDIDDAWQAAVAKPMRSGDIPWSVVVNDSKGMVTTRSGTVTVLPYNAPRLAEFSVQRYDEDTLDSGETVYVQTDDGQNVWMTILGDISPVNGLNAWTANLTIRKNGSQIYSGLFLSGSDGVEVVYEKDRTLYPDVVALTDDYTFTLTINDWFSTKLGTPVTITSAISKAEALMVVGAEAEGVSVGMYPGGSEYDKRFEVARDHTAHFYGGIQGVNNYVFNEVKTGGHWVDGRPLYKAIAELTVNTTSSDHSIPTPENAYVVFFQAFMRTVAESLYPLPSTHSAGTNYSIRCSWSKSDNRFLFQRGNAWTTSTYNGIKYIVIYEYVKSTDQPEILYPVRLNLGNGILSSNQVVGAWYGDNYVAQLTVTPGYALTNVAVSMGGTDITGSAYADGIINIPSVTGEIIVTATAKAIPAIVGTVTVGNVILGKE